MSQLSSVIQFGFAAFLAALAAYLVIRRRDKQFRINDVADSCMVFLVRDKQIVDANFSARLVLDRCSDLKDDFEKLQLFLGRHFHDVDRLLGSTANQGDVFVQSQNGQTQANRQVTSNGFRLTINFIESVLPDKNDIHTLRAIETELETLRANTSAAPFLLWRQNSEGEVIWANQAYLDAAQILEGNRTDTWPLPILFPSSGICAAPNSRESRRVCIARSGTSEDAWYDCHITSLGRDVLCAAVPADEAVRAENRRREFTQTLTKTFAELAIGLAIFDRSRRLVLFNPALLDLTGLPTDFLTSRPSLVSFLDRLRENRIMPEPRDYRSWRDSISELEAAAVDGTYSETWSLPDGQTYHVTGRPHPDGAVALLFEDISAEMALTRHFRTELELSQSVFDALEDAVAVFSSAGELTISNQAYCELWNIEPETSLVTGLTEATRRWHELTAPSPVWGDFREFAQQEVDREEWSSTVSLRDGRRLRCRFIPQKGGATMATFRVGTPNSLARFQEAV